MAMMNILTIQLVFLPLSLFIFIYFCIMRKHNSSLLTNWPLLGMTPALIMNAHRIHDFFTSLLQKNNQTFHFTGPVHMFCTCDPANINYILSKNFTNYPKGPDFAMIFDILGDGIFSSDGHLWEVQRKITMSLFNHARFYHKLQKTVRGKIEKGLIPLLDHVCKHEIEVDLQDIFKRLATDNICSLLLDYDPESLSLDLPCIPLYKAITDVEEAILYRHLVPVRLWKLQSWMGIGKEKSMSKAWKVIDDFIYTCISMKRQQVALKNSEHMSAADDEEADKPDFSTTFMELADKEFPGNPDKFLRDTLGSLMVGGRDTTSAALTWFFWLLSENPLVESRILEELKRNLHSECWMLFNKKEELQRLVYLHGALCEALRLFPSVPLNHKSPVQSEILPSGHRVEKDWKIVLSFYSMARMESIWGKDCLEFKPERWITDTGGIKHEPSFKFTAFNAGPRSCLGKDMALAQMKIVAATIIHDYTIQVVQGHPIVPNDSVIMEMKYGLKIRLAKRSCHLVPACK